MAERGDWHHVILSIDLKDPEGLPFHWACKDCPARGSALEAELRTAAVNEHRTRSAQR